MVQSPQPGRLPEPGVFSADELLRWRYQTARTMRPRLPPIAILTHQTTLLGGRKPWARDNSLAPLSFATRVRSGGSGSIVLAGCHGVGAPATAVVIEEMAVLGVKRLVAIDLAGSLVPSLRSGDLVLVEGALAGDGTSPHYSSQAQLRPGEPLTGALGRRLAEAHLPFSRGIVWSTDAVYHETPSQVREALGQGAVLADMEMAATLAVCAGLGIEAAAVLVVADELFDGWKPPTNMATLQARLKQALGAAATMLAS